MQAIEIPVSFTDEEALSGMRLSQDMLEELRPMIERSRRIARPKAAYRRAAVEDVDERGATVGGVRMDSRILAVNLKEQPFSVLYVCTCGEELEALARDNPDPIEGYLQYALNEFVLRLAMQGMRERISAEFGLAPMYAMSPGSLEDWPLTAQGPLFRALGDVSGAIGVQLTENFLMMPIKTVSGLFFTAEEQFVNCMLCPREDCTGRGAPYDPQLYQKRFASGM